MEHVDKTSSPHLSESGWRLFGELELPIGSEAEGVVSTWLTQTLNPLGLHTDFLNKVLKSAQDAAQRAMQSEDRRLDFGHIHLLLFFPGTGASTGQTWGFFRIEKIESDTQDKNPSDHAIEFYLYREGQ